MPIPSISLPGVATGTISGASIAFLEPATVLRCRGEVLVAMDETMQVGDKALIAFGLAIVSTDAFTLGATALPDPAGDANFPWLWWHQTLMASNLAVGLNNQGSSVARIVIDTKAMRKVKPLESLAMVFQVVAGTGSPVMDVDFSIIRVLIGT